jgi:hypothetical protein
MFDSLNDIVSIFLELHKTYFDAPIGSSQGTGDNCMK